MKEYKELNVLNNKLSKLILRKSVLKQKSEEFKSKYGTRNAKLTATQLKAKESLKEKYKINNAKISELKKMMKMNRIVMGKGGSIGINNNTNNTNNTNSTNRNTNNTNSTNTNSTNRNEINIENLIKEKKEYTKIITNQEKYAKNFPNVKRINARYNKFKDIYNKIYIKHIDPTIFLSTKFFLSFIYYFYDYFKQSNITDIDTFDRLKKTKEKDLNESVLNESVLNPIRYLFDRTHELHENNFTKLQIYKYFAIGNNITYLACEHYKKKPNLIYFTYFDKDDNTYYRIHIDNFQYQYQSGIMSINNLYNKNKTINHAVYFHKMGDKQYVIYDPNAIGKENAKFQDYFMNDAGLTFVYNLCAPAKASLNYTFTTQLKDILTSTICLIEDDECNQKDVNSYYDNINKWNNKGFCAYVSLFFSILSTYKNNSDTKTIVDIIKILNVLMSKIENVSNKIEKDFLEKAFHILSGIPSKEMFLKMKDLVESEVAKKKWLSFQLGEHEELTLKKFNRFIKEYNIIHKIDPNSKNVNFISSQDKNIYTKINNDKFFTSHIENFKHTYDCIYKRLLYKYDLNDYELIGECSLTDIRISKYQDFFEKHLRSFFF